jgi:glycerate 2-kinase
MRAMRLLACPDKFRGTLSAAEACTAIEAAAMAVGWTAMAQPMADGGEGTLDAFGGANRTTTVAGPLGEPVSARWRLRADHAVVEMAEASGLVLAGGAEGNDPMEATTAGTGELISAAAEAGARHIVVGLGGSATTDGGLGALKAMAPLPRFRGIDLEVACDVTTLFADAASVFGPQKGASPAQIALLTRRLDRLAEIYQREHGVAVGALMRSGAAGGLGGGLAAVGATLRDGFELISEEVDLYGQIEAVDLVVTGEGALDNTSFEGKVVGGVLRLAEAAGVAVVAVVGSTAPTGKRDWPIEVIDLSEIYGKARAISDASFCLTEALSDWLSRR